MASGRSNCTGTSSASPTYGTCRDSAAYTPLRGPTRPLSRGKKMNNKLYRIHRILAFTYAIFAALIVTAASFSSDHTASYFFLGFAGPPALIHAIAANGVSSGARWGRVMSRVIGIVLLIGFPVFTLIGVYILKQTGRYWQPAPPTLATGS